MRCGILVLALVLAACGSSAADSGGGGQSGTSATTSRPAAAAPCGPAKGRTLAASSQARVYVSAGAVYGCSGRTHRTTRLGQSASCIRTPRAGPAAVAGSLAGYGLQTCGIDTGSASVVVRRLSDGAVLRTLPASAGTRRPESYQSVLAIVLKPNGAAGWIAGVRSIVSHTAQRQVLAAGAGRAGRVLDSGGAIGPASLALHGSRLTWKNGGQTRSAPLR